MARCSKEEALATRHRLLDAAEFVFSKKGVSRTSLNEIAQTAGLTRGAVYWHFKNKADLFNTMMDRLTLPMEVALYQIVHDPGSDLLNYFHCTILETMRKITADERTRRVFAVASLKVEYVDEMLSIKDRHVKVNGNMIRQMERCISNACAHRSVSLPASPLMASQGLHALIMGLIDTWLLTPEAYELVSTADITIKAYLAGLGLEVASVVSQRSSETTCLQ